MLQSSTNTQMQKGKKKGYALGKRKQIEDIKTS